MSVDTLRRWDRAGKLADDARRAQPAARSAREVERLTEPAAAPRGRRRAVGPQPLPGRGALGRGRRRDGAGRDRGRAAPDHGGDHARRGGGARAGRGRAGDRGREGDVGDDRRGDG